MQGKGKRTVWERAKEAYKDKFGAKPSQVEFAKFAGVKQPSVSDWNKPGKYPEMTTATDIAERLDVAVEWLLTGRGPKHVPPVDKESQALWSIWVGLKDPARSRLLAYAAGLIDADAAGGMGSGTHGTPP